MDTTANRIKEGLAARNMKQTDIVEKTGITKSALSSYISGKYLPKQNNIYLIAKALNVSEAWLMGHDVPMTRILKHPAGRRINVYGRIPAGTPIEAVTDIIDWEEIPADWSGDYIALQVRGDSMEPEYRENDVIIVRVQSDCESGQDCAVYVNGYDATLKRVVKHDDCLLLQPLNPKYTPKVYNYNEEDGVTVLGVVVEMRRKKS